jgi:ADP-ribose pyrophosphatase YjhB (NUDIX family)
VVTVPRVLLVRDRTVAVHADGRLRLADRPEPGALDLGGGVSAALAAPDDRAAFADVRSLSPDLPPDEFALAATALALTAWHAEHPHCSRCGAATGLVAGGRRRACPVCGARHFPRTDPSVIALVTRGERALLVRRPDAIPGRYTCVSGFVDPGESAEEAVVREVAEETGLAVAPASVGSSPASRGPARTRSCSGSAAVAGPGEVVLQATSSRTRAGSRATSCARRTRAARSCPHRRCRWPTGSSPRSSTQRIDWRVSRLRW